MEFLQSFDNQLEDLLHRICVRLQITSTQRVLAESRYKSIAEWLAADESVFWGKDLDIYPQGSLRIGTTVKPLAHQEFDLDLVCEINRSWQSKNPLELLDAMEERLRQHKTYSPMIQRKNRCIRLDYANEFHMDLLPACPSAPIL
ncbi:nucleotidyltransferase domain-containing protein [Desulfosporosinus fructosivorans]